jgi:hypothetical protein
VLEEDREFQKKPFEEQRIVFCASTRAEGLLRSARLPKDCVVIVHHGDVNIQDDFRKVLDGSNAAHVFAQNCLVQDPRITPLPIGLEDQWHHQHGLVRDFRRLRRRVVYKIPRVIWGFSLNTNPDERWPCYRALVWNPLAVSLPVALNARLYRKYVHPYMFIASPPGNGADCHRTWEALYLGIVPIVMRSVMTEYFAGLGLPILVVDDWRELSAMNEEVLADTYERLKQGFDSKVLWLPFWKSQFEKRAGKGE